jgi:YD repeat-containing protein
VKGDRGDLATWQASTFYPLNQVIANPSGDLVKVTTAHTSGGSYDATKFGWVNNNAANLTGTLPEASLPSRLAEASLNATYAAAFADQAITYNGDGTVATVTDNGITTTYTYNGDGTVATDTRDGVTRNYTYTNGNLTGIEAS